MRGGEGKGGESEERGRGVIPVEESAVLFGGIGSSEDAFLDDGIAEGWDQLRSREVTHLISDRR